MKTCNRKDGLHTPECPDGKVAEKSAQRTSNDIMLSALRRIASRDSVEGDIAAAAIAEAEGH